MHVKYLPKLWALLRIALGWIFFWGFLDKVFGLGFTTAHDAAWIRGGSPTAGYLAKATHGPFVSLFQSLSGSVVVDWLFMLGLFGIGAALILGIGMRVASASGVVLLALMFLSALPPEHNPFMDEHIIYILVLLILPLVKADERWGLGDQWKKLDLVKKYKWLQ